MFASRARRQAPRLESRPLTFAAAVALSAALHALAARPTWQALAPGPPVFCTPGSTRASSLEPLAERRRALVAQAREERELGRLALGDFLLRAAELDEAALGRSLDLPRVFEEYEERLEVLRRELRAGSDSRPALFEAIGDLDYHGAPGGTVARALLEGGGSCEALALLVAAALHDAGFPWPAFVRHYGGAEPPHLSVIVDSGEGDVDVFTGAPAQPGGADLPASELVEVYARAHALELTPARGAARAGRASPLAEPTLARGFPENRDPFPGEVPLFAARALKPRVAPAGEDVTPADPFHCTTGVSLRSLDPRTVWLEIAGGRLETTTLLLPSRRQVEDLARDLLHHEGARDGAAGPRLVRAACMAVIATQLAIDLGLLGKPSLAEQARAQAVRARERAEQELAASNNGASLVDELSRLDDTWVLATLDAGRETWLKIGLGALAREERVHPLLIALLVRPETRDLTLHALDTLPLAQQLRTVGWLRAVSFMEAPRYRPAVDDWRLATDLDLPLVRAYRSAVAADDGD